MEIPQPKRILLLSRRGTSAQPVLNALTQSARSSATARSTSSSTYKPDPSSRHDIAHQPSSSSDATTIHIHRIENSYYRASVPIWTDEVLEPQAWAEQWMGEDGAADVIRAVGAWIVCFYKPGTEEQMASLKVLLTAISSVLTHHSSSPSASYGEPDSVLIAIAMHNPMIQSTDPPDDRPAHSDPSSDLNLDLDDLCRENGSWEYIDGTIPLPKSHSTSLTGNDDGDFGETVGIERLLEALEGGDWDATGGDMEGDDRILEDLDVDGPSDDEREHGFGGDGGDEFGEFFKGDIAAGFGEFLAAGRDARFAGLLAGDDDEENANNEDHKLLEHERTKDAAGEDETWQPRERSAAAAGREGPATTPGRRRAAKPNGGDGEVEGLQQMMLRLQAARDLGADLPVAERRKVAARAVREVMREI